MRFHIVQVWKSKHKVTGLYLLQKIKFLHITASRTIIADNEQCIINISNKYTQKVIKEMDSNRKLETRFDVPDKMCSLHRLVHKK